MKHSCLQQLSNSFCSKQLDSAILLMRGHADGESMKSTTRLVNDSTYTGAVLAPSDGVDLGMVRPWRIALVVKRMQVKLIVDLIDSLIIGRFDGDNNVLPDIDL